MTEYADLPQEAKDIISEEDYMLIQQAFTVDSEDNIIFLNSPGF